MRSSSFIVFAAFAFSLVGSSLAQTCDDTLISGVYCDGSDLPDSPGGSTYVHATCIVECEANADCTHFVVFDDGSCDLFGDGECDSPKPDVRASLYPFCRDASTPTVPPTEAPTKSLHDILPATCSEFTAGSLTDGFYVTVDISKNTVDGTESFYSPTELGYLHNDAALLSGVYAAYPECGTDCAWTSGTTEVKIFYPEGDNYQLDKVGTNAYDLSYEGSYTIVRLFCVADVWYAADDFAYSAVHTYNSITCGVRTDDGTSCEDVEGQVYSPAANNLPRFATCPMNGCTHVFEPSSPGAINGASGGEGPDQRAALAKFGRYARKYLFF
jgi:hypothetical protein